MTQLPRLSAYLRRLGYHIVPGSMMEGRAGVSCQVRTPPDPDRFTEVTPLNPRTWYVRISPRDYDNASITKGEF